MWPWKGEIKHPKTTFSLVQVIMFKKLLPHYTVQWENLCWFGPTQQSFENMATLINYCKINTSDDRILWYSWGYWGVNSTCWIEEEFVHFAVIFTAQFYLVRLIWLSEINSKKKKEKKKNQTCNLMFNYTWQMCVCICTSENAFVWSVDSSYAYRGLNGINNEVVCHINLSILYDIALCMDWCFTVIWYKFSHSITNQDRWHTCTSTTHYILKTQAIGLIKW